MSIENKNWKSDVQIFKKNQYLELINNDLEKFASDRNFEKNLHMKL